MDIIYTPIILFSTGAILGLLVGQRKINIDTALNIGTLLTLISIFTSILFYLDVFPNSSSFFFHPELTGIYKNNSLANVSIYFVPNVLLVLIWILLLPIWMIFSFKLSRYIFKKVINFDDAPHVCIIGGGFAGLWTLKELSKQKVKVTLIDKNNYHSFIPLIYQISTSDLSANDVIYPFRAITQRYDNIDFVLGEVKAVDPDKSELQIKNLDTKIKYDYLVISVGSDTNYFNVPGAKEFAQPLKTVADALNLKNKILTIFEKANKEEDNEAKKDLLTFSIVGGGPTGVEFASSFAELVKFTLLKDFKSISPNDVSIRLIELESNLLVNFKKKLGNYASKVLEKRGVELILNSSVKGVYPNYIQLSDGKQLASEVTIWTGGAKGFEFLKSWNLPVTKSYQIKVNKKLHVNSFENIFVAGDISFIENTAKSEQAMIAPQAEQQGKLVAKNIVRSIQSKKLKEFEYFDMGYMLSLGKNKGIVSFRKISITGLFAWIFWLVAHIYFIIGYRNKALTMINWFWSYVFLTKSNRAIIPV